VRCDGAEALLASHVPDLQLDLLAAECQRRGAKVDADRRLVTLLNCTYPAGK
jgi:hypothetical protein